MRRIAAVATAGFMALALSTPVAADTWTWSGEEEDCVAAGGTYERIKGERSEQTRTCDLGSLTTTRPAAGNGNWTVVESSSATWTWEHTTGEPVITQQASGTPTITACYTKDGEDKMGHQHCY
jgi:hypothetical protein